MTRNLEGWYKAKEESLKRDDYRCVITGLGSELTTIETHHIIQYKFCKCHDVDNLINLAHEVHKVIHKKCKIHGVRKNKMTSLDKNHLMQKYNEYLDHKDDFSYAIEFIQWLNSRPNYHKPYKIELSYHTQYIQKIFEMGYGVYINLYFKANGEVVLSYEIVRINNI